MRRRASTPPPVQRQRSRIPWPGCCGARCCALAALLRFFVTSGVSKTLRRV